MYKKQQKISFKEPIVQDEHFPCHPKISNSRIILHPHSLGSFFHWPKKCREIKPRKVFMKTLNNKVGEDPGEKFDEIWLDELKDDYVGRLVLRGANYILFGFACAMSTFFLAQFALLVYESFIQVGKLLMPTFGRSSSWWTKLSKAVKSFIENIT